MTKTWLNNFVCLFKFIILNRIIDSRSEWHRKWNQLLFLFSNSVPSISGDTQHRNSWSGTFSGFSYDQIGVQRESETSFTSDGQKIVIRRATSISLIFNHLNWNPLSEKILAWSSTLTSINRIFVRNRIFIHFNITKIARIKIWIDCDVINMPETIGRV